MSLHFIQLLLTLNVNCHDLSGHGQMADLFFLFLECSEAF